jgi:hypothetical protein
MEVAASFKATFAQNSATVLAGGAITLAGLDQERTS